VSDFLHAHSAYELIPESGKVVLLDVELPLRGAFHALSEQGLPSAPLWDGRAGGIVGMLSASDFIATLRRLRSAVSSGHNPLSEAEMDAHTVCLIARMRHATQTDRVCVGGGPNEQQGGCSRDAWVCMTGRRLGHTACLPACLPACS
jgi:hypothetical protein